MVRHYPSETCFLPWCEACGFGHFEQRFGYWEHQPDTRDKAFLDCCIAARRLIRAELARQALEMRAHSVDTIMCGPDAVTLNMPMVHAHEAALEGYDWLGAHPLRLPGEGA